MIRLIRRLVLVPLAHSAALADVEISENMRRMKAWILKLIATPCMANVRENIEVRALGPRRVCPPGVIAKPALQ